MKLSEDVKPVSYVKANVAELLREMEQTPRTIVITQNGEAKAVLQDIYTYESFQHDIDMLKLAAMGKKEVEAGRYRPARDVVKDIRNMIKSMADK